MVNFEQIISFESLYNAHRRARLGKRHKKEVILFEANLSENLWKLHYDLKYNRYNVYKYHSFMIYDPKEREIQAITYADRVIQHSICDNYLLPLLERRLIYDNAACRKNKGTSFAISRLKKFMTEFYKKEKLNGYFIKLDISKYFNSIDHDLLKNKIKKIVDNEKILNLLFNIINSYEFTKNKGLPMGNQTSQCFALFYLDNLDRFIKEELKVKYYIRYMDDMILLVKDKNQAKLILNKINQKVLENNLILNKKSQIIMLKNGIEFLGWRFKILQNGKILKTLKHQNKKRILKKLKTKKYYIKKLKNRECVINSYIGFFKKSNSYFYLKKLLMALNISKI